MLISLDDPEFVNELCTHFTRSGFGAEPVGGGMIEVARDDAPNPGQERLEIVLHLRLWEVMNPATQIMDVR